MNTPPSVSNGLPSAPRRKGYLRWLGPVASVVIFCASVGVLYTLLGEIELSEVTGALSTASTRQVGLALAFAALSYCLLTGYDALALRGLGLSLPAHTTALGSFASYAVSFTLGFPLATAATVRYWVYAPKGLRGSEVFQLTLIAGVTFWLGMGAVLGITLLWSAESAARLARATPFIMQMVGAGALAVVTGYLIWVSTGQRVLEVKGWRLSLPGFRITFGQLLLGAGDTCAAAAVLYVLLPGGHGIPYETFLAVYVFAALVGIASHAPGGLGVFEATILVAFSGMAKEPVLGALLLFRLFYYVIPFVLALLLLAGYEMSRRIRSRVP
jgi:glycosyltransferase 2 family protein